MAEAIQIKGLREFVGNLRKLDADLPKVLRVAFNEAATSIVDEAVVHIPKRTGRAASTVRARSTPTAVRVTGGGNRAPYYPWLDFGGRVGKGKSVVRPFYSDGRYIYASYFAKTASGEFQAALTRALLGAVERAGIEVD